MKKIFIIAGMLLLASGVRADTTDTKNNFYYVFHLYYDGGELKADRDFQFKYDIIPGEYAPGPVTTDFPYRGEVVNFTGDIASRFIFDPRHGDPKFTKGKITVPAPYIADAQRVVFYDAQNQPVLTVPVGESSFCNDDGICNADRGEDSSSCAKDCKQTLPAPPTATPVASAAATGSIWTSVLYILLGIIAIVLVWWFFWRRNRSSGMTPPPPSAPSAPLPTPPAPPGPENKL